MTEYDKSFYVSHSPKKDLTSFDNDTETILYLGDKIADLTISFDNVLGVVGAAKDNYHLLVVGLLLSVFLIATLATYFAEYIKKHQWLGYVGLFVILIISIQLIIGGFVNYEILSINEKYKFLFSI